MKESRGSSILRNYLGVGGETPRPSSSNRATELPDPTPPSPHNTTTATTAARRRRPFKPHTKVVLASAATPRQQSQSQHQSSSATTGSRGNKPQQQQQQQQQVGSPQHCSPEPVSLVDDWDDSWSLAQSKNSAIQKRVELSMDHSMDADEDDDEIVHTTTSLKGRLLSSRSSGHCQPVTKLRYVGAERTESMTESTTVDTTPTKASSSSQPHPHNTTTSTAAAAASRPLSLSNTTPRSPFSPLFRRTNQSRQRETPGSTNNINTDGNDADKNNDVGVDAPLHEGNAMSLSVCRKVSVVVSVGEDTSTLGTTEDQRCLFPLVTEATNINNSSHSEQPLPSSLSSTYASDARDLVVVNPTAFGQHIPVQVTMDTARLVAQLSNSNSEDWTRTYKYHQVIWPCHTLESLRNIGQAVINDMMAPGSIAHRLVIGTTASSSMSSVGAVSNNYNNNSSTTTTTRHLFGVVGTESVAHVYAKPDDSMTAQDVLERYGLVGLTVHGVLPRLPPHVVCSLTVVEITEDDETLHDLLASKPYASDARVKIRYGLTGTHITGLSEHPVESIKQVGHLLRRAFVAALHKHRRASRGHIVVTLSAFGDHEPKRRTSCQFVDLATVEHDKENQSAAFARRNASIRKSLTALGGVLRGALLKEGGNEVPVSFRESLLTKVLQRSMTQSDSRTLVLASVSPLVSRYEETMETLRFVNRLLYRPGLVLQSPQAAALDLNHTNLHSATAANTPFQTNKHVSLNVSMDRFEGRKSEILEEIISDPRQRLAKVMSPSPTKQTLDLTANEMDHHPIILTEYGDPENSEHGGSEQNDDEHRNHYHHPIDTETLLEDDANRRAHTNYDRNNVFLSDADRLQMTLPTPQARNGRLRHSTSSGVRQGTTTTSNSRTASSPFRFDTTSDAPHVDDHHTGNSTDHNELLTKQDEERQSPLPVSPLTADTGRADKYDLTANPFGGVLNDWRDHKRDETTAAQMFRKPSTTGSDLQDKPSAKKKRGKRNVSFEEYDTSSQNESGTQEGDFPAHDMSRTEKHAASIEVVNESKDSQFTEDATMPPPMEKKPADEIYYSAETTNSEILLAGDIDQHCAIRDPKYVLPDEVSELSGSRVEIDPLEAILQEPSFDNNTIPRSQQDSHEQSVDSVVRDGDAIHSASYGSDPRPPSTLSERSPSHSFRLHSSLIPSASVHKIAESKSRNTDGDEETRHKENSEPLEIEYEIGGPGGESDQDITFESSAEIQRGGTGRSERSGSFSNGDDRHVTSRPSPRLRNCFSNSSQDDDCNFEADQSHSTQELFDVMRESTSAAPQIECGFDAIGAGADQHDNPHETDEDIAFESYSEIKDCGMHQLDRDKSGSQYSHAPSAVVEKKAVSSVASNSALEDGNGFMSSQSPRPRDDTGTGVASSAIRRTNQSQTVDGFLDTSYGSIERLEIQYGLNDARKHRLDRDVSGSEYPHAPSAVVEKAVSSVTSNSTYRDSDGATSAQPPQPRGGTGVDVSSAGVRRTDQPYTTHGLLNANAGPSERLEIEHGLGEYDNPHDSDEEISLESSSEVKVDKIYQTDGRENNKMYTQTTRVVDPLDLSCGSDHVNGKSLVSRHSSQSRSTVSESQVARKDTEYENPLRPEIEVKQSQEVHGQLDCRSGNREISEPFEVECGLGGIGAGFGQYDNPHDSDEEVTFESSAEVKCHSTNRSNTSASGTGLKQVAPAIGSVSMYKDNDDVRQQSLQQTRETFAEFGQQSNVNHHDDLLPETMGKGLSEPVSTRDSVSPTCLYENPNMLQEPNVDFRDEGRNGMPFTDAIIPSDSPRNVGNAENQRERLTTGISTSFSGSNASPKQRTRMVSFVDPHNSAANSKPPSILIANEFPQTIRKGEVDNVQASPTDVSAGRNVLNEIDDLEAAVDQVKRTNIHVWQSSLAAIDNLRYFQTSQENALSQVLSERDEAIQRNTQLKAELRDHDNTHRNEKMRMSMQFEVTKAELKKAESDQLEIVKICEEAIATQADLEQKNTKLDQELAYQISVSTPKDAFIDLQRRFAGLKKELEMAKSEKLRSEAKVGDQAIAISELQFSVQSYEEELKQLVDERARHVRQLHDQESEIETLRVSASSAAKLKAESTRLSLEAQSIQSSFRRREAELLREQKSKDDCAQRCLQERDELTQELLDVREEAELEANTSRIEIESLREELLRLEEELASLSEKLKQSEKHSREMERNRIYAVEELTKTQAELNRRVSDVRELTSNTKSLLSEKEKNASKLASLKSEISYFQNETRSQVHAIVHHRDEAAALLEQTVKENKALVETNQKLQTAFEEVRNQRDEAEIEATNEATFEAERIASANRELERENQRLLAELEISRHDPLLSQARMFSPNSTERDHFIQGSVSRDADSFVYGVRSRQNSQSPYIGRSRQGGNRVPMDERSHLERAEDVAAYIAMSAKSTIDKTDLSSQRLENKIYAVEDAKDVEINTLKSRIKQLERTTMGNNLGEEKLYRTARLDNW